MTKPEGPQSKRSTEKSVIDKERIRFDNVTIYRTPTSPKWYISYTVNSKQIRRSLKTTKKKVAVDLAKKKDAELTLKLLPTAPKGDARIAETVRKYLESISQKKSAGTLKVYRVDLADFAAYAEWRGTARLDQIDAEFLESYQQLLHDEGMSKIIPLQKGLAPRRPCKQNTIHNKLKVVRQMTKWAVRRDILATDPARGYDLARRSTDPTYCWSADELRLVLTHVTSKHVDMFNFFRLTGLRADELCWLTKDDLSFDPPHIKIRSKTCTQTRKRWSPKHGNERIVPLCADAVAIARRVESASSTVPWLFSSGTTRRARQGQYTPGVIRAAVKRAMKAAGVSRGTTHTFRHVFCSYMANKNVPPLMVMKIMGHRSLSIVLTYYHAADRELIDVVSRVDFGGMLSEGGKGDQQTHTQISEVLAK